MSGHEPCRCGKPITDGARPSALWAAQRGVLVVPGDEPTKPHTHGAARWVIKARLTTPWREVPNA